MMFVKEQKQNVGKKFIDDGCFFTPNGNVFWD